MVNIRHFTRRDMSSVLELLHADQLPSQPRCMVRDVQQALAGRATIDRKWWEALVTIRAIVATEGNDEDLGRIWTTGYLLTINRSLRKCFKMLTPRTSWEG